MRKLLRKIFGIKAPLLQWVTQDMTAQGGSVMTYAKSSIGVYEIYWGDDSNEFLLSYPDGTPAELFGKLFKASDAAQDHFERAYFAPQAGSKDE